MIKKLSLAIVFLFCFFPALPVLARQVVLNEIYPYPKTGESEFIELKNLSTEKINLKNWSIRDDTNIPNHKRKINEDLLLNPGEIIYLEDNFYLNNDEDKVFLLAPDDKEEDVINYKKAEKEMSWSLFGSEWKWALSTKGCENLEKESIVYSGEIYLNEILPNPSGDESQNEYIELYNPTEKDIDLANWILKDGSASGKYIFPKNSTIKAEAFLIIYRKDFKFALNNSDESVRLFDPNEKLVSEISFSESAKEDVSYNFSESGKWRWSQFLTPGKENEFNDLPKYEITKDSKFYVNVWANFSVRIRGKDEEKIKVTWDFGDDHKAYKKETRHKYEKTGKYTATLKITDGSEDILEEFSVQVKKFGDKKISLLAVSPNPKGKDSKNEWIKIQNNSTKKINLKNWSIATGWKNLYNHPIRSDFILKSGETKILARNICAFTLANTKNKIELRKPDGKVADRISYEKEKIPEGEIYEKNGKTWKWKNSNPTLKATNGDSTSAVEAESPGESEVVPEEIVSEDFGKATLDESKKENRIAYLFPEKNITTPKNLFRGKVLGASTIQDEGEFYSFTHSKKEPSRLQKIETYLNYLFNQFFLKFTF